MNLIGWLACWVQYEFNLIAGSFFGRLTVKQCLFVFKHIYSSCVDLFNFRYNTFYNTVQIHLGTKPLTPGVMFCCVSTRAWRVGFTCYVCFFLLITTEHSNICSITTVRFTSKFVCCAFESHKSSSYPHASWYKSKIRLSSYKVRCECESIT